MSSVSEKVCLSPLLLRHKPGFTKDAVCDLLLKDGYSQLSRLVDSPDTDQEQLSNHLFHLFRSTNRMNDLLKALFKDVDATSLREEINSVRVFVLGRISRYGKGFLQVCIGPVLSRLKKAKKSRSVVWWAEEMWTLLQEHISTMNDPVKVICQVLYQKTESYQVVCGYFFLRFFNPYLLNAATKQDDAGVQKMAIEIAKLLQMVGNGNGDSDGDEGRFVREKMKQLPDLFSFICEPDLSGWRYTNSPFYSTIQDRKALDYFSHQLKLPTVKRKECHPLRLNRVQSEDKMSTVSPSSPRSPRSPPASPKPTVAKSNSTRILRLKLMQSMQSLQGSQRNLARMLHI